MSWTQLNSLDTETLELIQEYNKEDLENLLISAQDALDFYDEYHKLTEEKQDKLWEKFDR